MTSTAAGHRFVVRELGIITDADRGSLPLSALAKAALRSNPRRAHLLVSTVLGKHQPQRPEVIRSTEELLGNRVLAALNGVNPNDRADLEALRQALTHGTQPPRYAPSVEFRDQILVLGFAEAAAALGAGVAAHLGSWYACSTRYPTRDAHLVFEEEHSHATGHHLTPTRPGPLTDPTRTVILVDDELTTGRTVQNIVRAMLASGGQRKYIVATITDLRSDADIAALNDFASRHGVEVTVVALHQSRFDVPADAVQRAEPLVEQLRATPPAPTSAGYGDVIPFDVVPLPSLADGTSDLTGTFSGPAVAAAHRVAAAAHGTTLVLGVEEDMYFPLLLADTLATTHDDAVLFGSTTRSPAFAHDDPEYGIRDRIEYVLPDGQRRYGYNFGTQNDTIVVFSSGRNSELGTLIAELRRRAKRVIHVAARVQRDALTGPTFGSYTADDVEWLLTDISDADLELSINERENAIQAGQNYAEALPIEFVPSDDYQRLYDDALHRNASQVARHVEAVSDQVLAARGRNVVLVSLARAGVPIGALIRRYLINFRNTDAPHYAVSIVRGIGIDTNALDYITARHNPSDVIFIDGWTGKGAITRELTAAITDYNTDNGTSFSPDLAVLADPGHSAAFSGTFDDYLIPSAALNSTVSGLVSRTVYNRKLIGDRDFHGGKYYADLAAADVSNAYLDTIAAHFSHRAAVAMTPPPPTWSGWAEVERLGAEYGIPNLNRIKPGVGETTRVLLRRVPWKILVRAGSEHTIPHIIRLADERDVPIATVEGLAFTAVGLVKDAST